MAASDVTVMDMSEGEINTVTEVMGVFTVTKSQRQGIMGWSQAVGWTDFRVRKRISQETLKPTWRTCSCGSTSSSRSTSQSSRGRR